MTSKYSIVCLKHSYLGILAQHHKNEKDIHNNITVYSRNHDENQKNNQVLNNQFQNKSNMR